MAIVSNTRRGPFLLKVLDKKMNSISHLVDVGGGDGATALFLSKHFSTLKVTVFDLPSVCETASANIQKQGRTTQVVVHPGDMFSDPFPSSIEAVLFASLLTIFSEVRILELLAKAFHTLPKGGMCIIHTLVSNENETGPLLAAQMSLYFSALASGSGMAYPISDYEKWLRETGFSNIEIVKHPKNETVAVILATK
jgi:ubiquinone/menaquinone biosynthesis C-methylase UbiE